MSSSNDASAWKISYARLLASCGDPWATIALREWEELRDGDVLERASQLAAQFNALKPEITKLPSLSTAVSTWLTLASSALPPLATLTVIVTMAASSPIGMGNSQNERPFARRILSSTALDAALPAISSSKAHPGLDGAATRDGASSQPGRTGNLPPAPVFPPSRPPNPTAPGRPSLLP